MRNIQTALQTLMFSLGMLAALVGSATGQTAIAIIGVAAVLISLGIPQITQAFWDFIERRK